MLTCSQIDGSPLPSRRSPPLRSASNVPSQSAAKRALPLWPPSRDIINIYAPNTLQEQILLWQALVNSLPFQGRWIFYKDWNMVELEKDKSSPQSHILSGAERLEFELFKSHFQIHDFLNPNQSFRFTWLNQRKREQRVLAHLD